MKRIFIYLSCMAMMAGQVSFANTFKLDTTKSFITWEGSKPIGSHNGKVQFKEGSIVTKGSTVTSANFVADMTSITCDDLKGKQNKKIVAHLNSKDFFDTATYPTATFKFEKVDLMKGGKYQFKGILTLLDVSKPVYFVADVKKDANKISAKTTFTIDRTDWGLKFKSKNFFENIGDKFIHDDMKIGIQLVATAQPEKKTK